MLNGPANKSLDDLKSDPSKRKCRSVLPYKFIHSTPSSRDVNIGKEVEALLISLSIKEKIMRRRDSNGYEKVKSEMAKFIEQI